MAFSIQRSNQKAEATPVAEDTRFNVKKFMDHVVWTPTWLSNGHFAVKKMLVKLGEHLTSNDALICAYPNATGVMEWDDEKIVAALGTFDGLRVEFIRSPWCHRNAALFLDENGNAAWFNADYCDALNIAALYGPSAMFAKAKTKAKADEIDASAGVPYISAPTFEEASIVIMPMRVPVDWDQVARTVASATSLEEAAPERFNDMPAPEEPEAEKTEEEKPEDGPQMPLGSLAEAVMDDLQNPNSAASKEIRKSVKKSGGKVTISVGKRSVTVGGEGAK
jgi:hypothetical protein